MQNYAIIDYGRQLVAILRDLSAMSRRMGSLAPGWNVGDPQSARETRQWLTDIENYQQRYAALTVPDSAYVVHAYTKLGFETLWQAASIAHGAIVANDDNPDHVATVRDLIHQGSAYITKASDAFEVLAATYEQ